MQRKYVIIYDDLVNEIVNKKWKAFDMLPSENELAKEYNTSRETVRKALNLLSQNGYIQKIQGKGSMVLDIHKFSLPVSGIVSFKEIARKQKLESRTILHSLGLLEKNHPMYEKLKRTKHRIWAVERVREISGEKIILDKDYFSDEYVPLLTEDIAKGSIYEYLEDELGLSIGFAHKEIVVEEVTEEDKELLDVNGFQVIVVIKSLVYLDDANIFQYNESRHRPDKFRFVDFARRIK
ncbi:trehalose operon repressor [Ornithinibacillus halotolerans]|uniref:Trehalose operon repressor n=1 Tax=Ornithinibacillus halotolerans TaxID=1274357 RepID=A0A916S4R1_9BACI|nr:trehalose operon repressor [Ornithinibacillus halotolerans]GGA84446.1 trehalose operon repressor [Ornithinibacillus halotolerans]